ncbi:hypothetical protein ACFWJ4_15195 [Kitasatospora sp. NPDC127067]|uniref:hypothetical protein n=1 Tax=Kitasatospora sp. NPDC127067 TaxID=3347126 RepID=UPI003669C437
MTDHSVIAGTPDRQVGRLCFGGSEPLHVFADGNSFSAGEELACERPRPERRGRGPGSARSGSRGAQPVEGALQAALGRRDGGVRVARGDRLDEGVVRAVDGLRSTAR